MAAVSSDLNMIRVTNEAFVKKSRGMRPEAL